MSIGRFQSDDSEKALTMLLCQAININTGLSPAAIEAELKISSAQPGSNWRRWSRGDRALDKKARSDITKIAIKKVWLSPKTGFTLPHESQINLISKFQDFETFRQELKNAVQRQKNLSKAVSSAETALAALSKILHETEYLFIDKDDPVEFMKYYDLEGEVDSLNEKIKTLSFPLVKHEVNVFNF